MTVAQAVGTQGRATVAPAPVPGTARRIVVGLREQRLWLRDAQGACLAQFPVSSAASGAGQREGSERTPLGRHVVRARIGAGLPPRAVLRGRRPTGEVWTPQLHAQYPARDWILSRILWLSGTEPGFNRLGNVDSMRRYIYIHGTPPVEPMGEPRSHGCIRMRNGDVIRLFEAVGHGTEVVILAEALP